MSMVNQEAVATFAEALSIARNIYHQKSYQATVDSRPMIYIPDGFRPETLRKLLQVMRQL